MWCVATQSDHLPRTVHSIVVHVIDAAPIELHFDFATKSARIGDRTIVDGPGVSRPFEILLILYSSPGRRFFVSELGRELTALPRQYEQIGLLLSRLKSEFLIVTNDGQTWGARGPDIVRVSPSPSRLLECLEVIRTSRRSKERRQVNSPDQTIIQAAHLKQTGDLGGLVALLSPRLQSIERSSSTRQRPGRLAIAYTLLSEAFMAFGDSESALLHGERALMWLRQIATTNRAIGPTDVLIRVLATEAATHRIAAAIVSATNPTAAKSHLEQAESKFAEAMNALRNCTDLPGEVMDERYRWIYASSTTPLILRNELRSASQNLNEAERLAARVRSDGAEFGETWLLRARQLIAGSDITGARTKVNEVNAYVEARATPHWLQAWLPIYQANIAFALREPREQVREYLLAAWRAPTQAPFQRLRILARFASWDIEPGRDAIEDRGQIVRFLWKWHPRLTGVPSRSCVTCQNPPTGWQLLSRIQCTMRIGRGDSLGLWE